MLPGKQSDELKKLSEYFPKESKLYAVGGCVRDALRGKDFYDIDLAGALLPDQLTRVLDGSQFKVFGASPRLGTLIIKGEYAYEYTTFRTDSYPVGSGIHTPTSVTFTDDIVQDAKRRDFKCNAVYYDILNDKIVDPLGGREDIENQVLSTVVDPQITLGQDGLRIMRLLRFVSKLGFSVQENTLAKAKELVGGLADISVERVREELDKILAGDNCYRALKMMNEIGALAVILPEVADNDGVEQNPTYHKYDVLEHTFRVVEQCPVAVRLAGLFHDVAKGVCKRNDGNTYRHAVEGAKITRSVLTRLKYPNKTIEKTVRMVSEHMFDINGNARESKCRRFIANNIDILDDMLALFDADSKGTGNFERSRTADNLRKIYAKMLEQKVPFSLAQLAINGKDLLAIGCEGKAIGDILIEIWDKALLGALPNDRERLLEIAKRLKYYEEKRTKKNG